MPSRAFFRCRACGEPVVAGAYRCPVCGTNFPAGKGQAEPNGAPASPEASAPAAAVAPETIAPAAGAPPEIGPDGHRGRTGEKALARLREREAARSAEKHDEPAPPPRMPEPAHDGFGDTAAAMPAEGEQRDPGRNRGRLRAKRDALPLMGSEEADTHRSEPAADRAAARRARQQQRRERAQDAAGQAARIEPAIAPARDASPENQPPSEGDIFSEPLDARQFDEGLDFEDNLEREIQGEPPAAAGLSIGEETAGRKNEPRTDPQSAGDELGVAPVRDLAGAREAGIGAASVLSVRPAELRDSSHPAAPEPDRRRAPMVVEPDELEFDEELAAEDEEANDTPPARRKPRRSKADALTGTLLAGLVVVAAVFAVVILSSGREDEVDQSGQFARALGVPSVIAHGEGWVNIPNGTESLSLSAEGPFRVRVSGTVYTIEGGTTLTLSRGGGTAIAVRAIEPGANVAVSLQQ